MTKEIIRRSVSIPKELDDKISIMTREFSYPVKNQLIVELLELGILKYNEDMEIKNSINLLIKKVENLCESISTKL